MVSAACGEPCPETKEEKIAFALRNHIAVWDVLASCEIRGAEDGSIRNPVPNDMDVILKHADIRAVFATGAKAAQLYKRQLLSENRYPGSLPAIHQPCQLPDVL